MGLSYSKPPADSEAGRVRAKRNKLPESPHYSDQCVLRGPGELRSHYFNPDELAGVAQSSESFETGIAVGVRQ